MARPKASHPAHSVPRGFETRLGPLLEDLPRSSGFCIRARAGGFNAEEFKKWLIDDIAVWTALADQIHFEKI